MKRYHVNVDGEVFDVTVEEITLGSGGSVVPPRIAPPPVTQAPVVQAPAPAPQPEPTAATTGGHILQAPMPGKILKVSIEQGDTVKNGDVLIILEAMKMENDIMAPIDGKISSVKVREGDSVSTGDVLVVID